MATPTGEASQYSLINSQVIMTISAGQGFQQFSLLSLGRALLAGIDIFKVLDGTFLRIKSHW